MKISPNSFAKLLAVVVLAYGCSSARAETLFDNGSTTGTTANTAFYADPSSGYYEAGDVFTPTASGTASYINFVGFYVTSPVTLPADNFTITLDSTTLGLPDTLSPSTPTSSITDLSRTLLSDASGSDIYQYSGYLSTPFALSTGTSYFLGFTDTTSPGEEFVIATTDTPGPATDEFSFLDGSTSYSADNPGYSLAFDLETAVPEPSTWAMLLSGLALLGFCARRKLA